MSWYKSASEAASQKEKERQKKEKMDSIKDEVKNTKPKGLGVKGLADRVEKLEILLGFREE